MEKAKLTKAEILKQISMIDPSKKCLEFLKNRIQNDNYRGMQISQHNRYTVEDVKTILLALNKYLDSDGFLQIRDTDLSKRPFNVEGEENYANFINEVNKKRPNSKGTQDSIRKNYFVDFHRMCFINRFDKDKKETDPYRQSRIKFVGLTDLGKQFINEANIINEKYYNTKILSEYILEYRTMSKFQQKALDEYLALYCDPDTFSGDKTNKRDYHNWKNETQQIFSLLDQTSYFEIVENKLCVRSKNNPLFDISKKGYKRSVAVKDEYFKNHNLKSEIGYELHHIVPLCSAKNLDECDVIDAWQNLLYIDGKTHDKISQTSNKNIILKNKNDDFLLKHIVDETKDIYCKKGDNVLYNIRNQRTMLDYNAELLNAKMW